MEDLKVLEAAVADMNKIVERYKTKCEKEQAKKKEAYVSYQGVKYYSENEIMEAYGCDAMTSAKCDSLIEKLNKKLGIEDSWSKTFNQQMFDYFEKLRDNIQNDINHIVHMQKVAAERDERIKADIEKGCTYKQAMDNETFRENCIQMENAGIL